MCTGYSCKLLCFMALKSFTTVHLAVCSLERTFFTSLNKGNVLSLISIQNYFTFKTDLLNEISSFLVVPLEKFMLFIKNGKASCQCKHTALILDYTVFCQIIV